MAPVADVKYDERVKKWLLSAFRQAELSQIRFCKEFGISRMTLYKWLKEEQTKN